MSASQNKWAHNETENCENKRTLWAPKHSTERKMYVCVCVWLDETDAQIETRVNAHLKREKNDAAN